MLPRPFTCEQCHATFRKASGREWHIAHRHDAPTTLASIRREYKAKTNQLEAVNLELTSKNQQMEQTHFREKLGLITDLYNSVILVDDLNKEVRRLNYENQVALLTLAIFVAGTKQSQTT
ncbi:MAG: hypothetical protein TUN42_03555 [Dehalogenimonas sp.]